MKKQLLITIPSQLLLFLFGTFTCLHAQIPPPGYERELQLLRESQNMSPLDRDSMMVTDTVTSFNPETDEESIVIVNTNYSLRDFCTNVLGMRDPTILLDGKPHVIIDPKTYKDLTVRYNQRDKKIEILQGK